MAAIGSTLNKKKQEPQQHRNKREGEGGEGKADNTNQQNKTKKRRQNPIRSRFPNCGKLKRQVQKLTSFTNQVLRAAP